MVIGRAVSHMVESQHRAQVASNPPTLALGSLRLELSISPAPVIAQLALWLAISWSPKERGASPSPLLPITPGCLSAATPMLRPSVGHNNKTETLPMSGGGTIDCSAVSDPLPFLPIAMRRVVYEPVVAPRGQRCETEGATGNVLGRRQVSCARIAGHAGTHISKPHRALRLVGRPWAYAWR